MMTLHAYTGPTGAESPPLTEVTFLSIDGLGSPNDFPVARGTRSFERWLRAKTTVRASRFWISATNIPSGVTIKLGTADAYSQPTNAASAIATRTMSEGERYVFHTLDTDLYTRYCVLQASVDATAGVGGVSGVEIEIGWHEDRA